ncbi:MAG: anhydro-N-acetylmuramic acid kinase [Planctomycetota bacterium]|jgi:1,6-anhydro-N-acetylmuramate kinase
MPDRLAIGCMSGTSLDAIDAVLVRIEGEGLSMRANLLATASHPLGDLGVDLSKVAFGAAATAQQITGLALRLGQAHVEVIEDLLSCGGARTDPISLIAVHGQTLYHAPPLSLQLINPAPIANTFHAPVGYDFRAADLAAGGQGAPITPLADYILFGHPNEQRAIVNLGGFINYTYVPKRSDNPSNDLPDIRGRDLCACNQLLDAIARHGLNQPYDKDGRAAASGKPHPDLTSTIFQLLDTQARAGRSLGSGDELNDRAIRALNDHTPHDLASSACVAIAQVLAAQFSPGIRLILAGGGAKNTTLVQAIQNHLAGTLSLSDSIEAEASIDVEYREAMAMAVLGALSRDGVPITLPQVTGCPSPAPLAGCWTQA